MKKRLSIVYDVTRQCPWNCAICCMGATPYKINCEDELAYAMRFCIPGQLIQLKKVREIYMDLSGGEIFTDLRNIELIESVSTVLGKDHVGISTSGFNMTDCIAESLSRLVNNVELSMDVLPGVKSNLRPLGYANAAANAVRYLNSYDIEIGIQTVLTKSNNSSENLSNLYTWVCNNNVSEWSILRFYPTGRGKNFKHEQLTECEAIKAVKFVQSLNRRNSSEVKPRLHFHYTMKGHEGYTEQCRCVEKSVGILPDGTVTACFWAVDEYSHVIDDKYKLGNLKTDTLYNILTGNKAKYWTDNPHSCEVLNKNFG